jgi:hypothetical protein
MIETTLSAGTYYIAVDGNAVNNGAEYTLTITTCEAGDSYCGN